MGHRLLKLYPSLYQLCWFDLTKLKKDLSQMTEEDISALSERMLIERMDAVYQSLSDGQIMTSKAQNSVKICHISEAMFISLPCGFHDHTGNELRLHMVRSADKQNKSASFQFVGFDKAMSRSASPKHTALTQLSDSQIRRAKRVMPRHMSSPFCREIESLQIEIAESLMRLQLTLRELNDLREKLSIPLPEAEKISLFGRLKKRLREIIGL